MILYLHGFRSSPQSSKAQILINKMRALGLSEQLQTPSLLPSPADSMTYCLDLAKQMQEQGPLCIIGSSLGGYYATYLAETLDCKAVLINPSIYAARDLSTQVGPLYYYHNQEPFMFQSSYIHELAELFVPTITPERFFLLAGTADETLDWQEMAHRYKGAKQLIIEGQDHSFGAFEQHLPEILSFAGY